MRLIRLKKHPARFCSIILALLFAITSATALAQSSAELMGQRRLPPQPPARPEYHPTEPPSEPIPEGWIIAGACLAAAAVVALLYRSVRVWRSSDIFDREYHFPRGESPAIRLGAKRNGGQMATIHFGEPPPPA